MKGRTTAETMQDVATKRCILVSGLGAREEKLRIEARMKVTGTDIFGVCRGEVLGWFLCLEITGDG